MVPRLWPDVLSAFALLTRLPLPDHKGSGAASAWAWPLVGGILGAIAAGFASLALWLGLTPGVVAAAVLGVLAFLTGALHEDGLSDTADGLFGGWTRERRLEIMKDSRIGSYGMLALLLVTLARWSALVAILSIGAHWAALITAGAVSRAPMAVIMSTLPNARGAGLSHATGQPDQRTALIGAALALATAVIFTGQLAIPMLALVALATGLLALSAHRRIGGQTGDILGASQQLAEAACLAVLAASAG
ncbi:MAG: adenosylcobinamide-GDP ribazoletransferase [Rhodobacter sp.]|nr:adenosylcobinamide-GDP ribazoletransferase [Rhodobacter sp.]